MLRKMIWKRFIYPIYYFHVRTLISDCISSNRTDCGSRFIIGLFLIFRACSKKCQFKIFLISHKIDIQQNNLTDE